MTTTPTDRRYGVISGLAIKGPCQGVSLANITLAGEQTINGHAAVSGERFLVAGQTDQTTNGVYRVATGPWVRDLDFDGSYDVVEGSLVFVNNDGAESQYSIYIVSTEDPITIGTTPIAFTKFSLSFTGGTVSAITITGNAGIGGNETVTGTLGVTGATTLTTLAVSGASTMAGETCNGYDYTPTVTVAAAATTSLNANLSDVFRVTMGANITTLTISNQHDGQCFKIGFKQDGTGGRTIAWPANFHWPNGTIPILSTAANALDVLFLQYDATDGYTANLGKGFA